jgi:rod shape-determining protein MreD
MRYLILLAISAVDLIFANTVFPNINIAGIAPDIIICTMVSITILENSMTGAWFGLLCGLAINLFAGVIGFYAIPYFLTGALVYFIRKNVNYFDRFLLPLSFAAGAYIIKEAFNALLAYMLNKQFSLSYMFIRYFLPEAVATAALMLLVHFLMIKVYGLNYMKKKSNQDFRRLS